MGFDCGAKYHGTSINHQLLQGPDLMTNPLVGVLIRFRQESVAMAADIVRHDLTERADQWFEEERAREGRSALTRPYTVRHGLRKKAEISSLLPGQSISIQRNALFSNTILIFFGSIISCTGKCKVPLHFW